MVKADLQNVWTIEATQLIYITTDH